jgi:hypothetical protein
MAHEDDVVVLGQIPPGLVMDLCHERARGIDHGQIVPFGCGGTDSGRDPVRSQDDSGAVGYLFEFGHEYGTLGFEIVHDMDVVNDLPADVDRSAEPLQGALDNFDGAFDTRTE